MNAFDWYNVLTPLALIAVCLNVLISFLLKPEFRLFKLRKLSIIAYAVMLIGWSIMFFAIKTLTANVMFMTYVAIVGWLLLLPAMILVTITFFMQLRAKKEQFTPHGYKIINGFYQLPKMCCMLLFGLLAILVKCTKRSTHFTYKNEANDQNNPYMFGGPLFGNPPQDLFGDVKYSDNKKASLF